MFYNSAVKQKKSLVEHDTSLILNYTTQFRSNISIFLGTYCITLNQKFHRQYHLLIPIGHDFACLNCLLRKHFLW